jgi:prevent-host-death family protein
MTGMHAIGIKELKAKLSEYVRAARAGETVLVTDRGEVVAALGPASNRVREIESESVEARFAEAERRGLVTPARLPKEDWKWRPQGLNLSNEQIDALLDDLRADRFET